MGVILGPVGAEEHVAGHVGGVAGLPVEEEQVPGGRMVGSSRLPQVTGTG